MRRIRPTRASNSAMPWRPGSHGWADLLRLLDELRRLAFDRSLDDADRSRRIRDWIGEYNGRFDDDC
jgi:hypothetical protein